MKRDEKRDGFATIVYYEKLWKTKEKEKVVYESKNGFGTRLHVGKVLAPPQRLSKDITFNQNEK